MTWGSIGQDDHLDELAELAPDAEQITPYDRLHLPTYLNLLKVYARDDGANSASLQADLARVADMSPSPIRTVLSHLKRALWLVESGDHLWPEDDVEALRQLLRD